jgi:hypothetical protein
MLPRPKLVDFSPGTSLTDALASLSNIDDHFGLIVRKSGLALRVASGSPADSARFALTGRAGPPHRRAFRVSNLPPTPCVRTPWKAF